MKTKALLIAAALMIASPARAALIAGWDFSQYFSAGLLSTDGATFTDTLDANYSSLDPTGNAGAESAAFGTMFMDGTNGSSDVDEASAGAAFTATSGSLASNLGAPSPNPFDSLTVLSAEGQTFTSLLSMTAQSAVSVVFQADLGSIADVGSNFELSLGARTFSGVTTVGVEFSLDGLTYDPVTTLNLDATDTPFTGIALGGTGLNAAWVRLNFSDPIGGGDGQAIIDNLALSADLGPAVPEPGTLALVGSGLLGLYIRGRRS
jgi:hypothetical protein